MLCLMYLGFLVGMLGMVLFSGGLLEKIGWAIDKKSPPTPHMARTGCVMIVAGIGLSVLVSSCLQKEKEEKEQRQKEWKEKDKKLKEWMEEEKRKIEKEKRESK